MDTRVTFEASKIGHPSGSTAFLIMWSSVFGHAYATHARYLSHLAFWSISRNSSTAMSSFAPGNVRPWVSSCDGAVNRACIAAQLPAPHEPGCIKASEAQKPEASKRNAGGHLEGCFKLAMFTPLLPKKNFGKNPLRIIFLYFWGHSCDPKILGKERF